MSQNDGNPSSKKGKTFTDLARHFSLLPTEKKKVSIEMSASLATISLKASREFVKNAPQAAEILSADELRTWAEIGKRVVMTNANLGVGYFAKGVNGLRGISAKSRSFVFRICMRQLILSSSISLETFDLIPSLANKIKNKALLTDILELASEIAKRSAKHSADFLRKTPEFARSLEKFGRDRQEVSKAALHLASHFAVKTGGMTVDLWSNLPDVFAKLSADKAIRLMERGRGFIDYGGNVTLHFITSGCKMLNRLEAVFEEWCSVSELFTAHGNAILISFLRSSPQLFRQIEILKSGSDEIQILRRILQLIKEIVETDAESALAALHSSAQALEKVSLEQFEEWVERGLATEQEFPAKSRRSFFALETRRSNEVLRGDQEGLSLENIQTVLRTYVEGLTGKVVEIAPTSAIPQGVRIGDGKTIYLPSNVNEFGSEDLDFGLYKVLAAHGAGQIEFGTFETDTEGLKAAFKELSELYEASPEQLDAFSLAGYIEEVQKGETALSEEEFRKELEKNRKRIPTNIDYRSVLKTFPEPHLARQIFGAMENARVDHRLRRTYRGLVKYLDVMQNFLRERRPYIFDLPAHQTPFEILFQITMCGGTTDDARRFYGQVVSEIETVTESYLSTENASVADSVMATSRIYSLFQNISFEGMKAENSEENREEREYDEKDAQGDTVAELPQEKYKEKPPDTQDIKDLFAVWNTVGDEEGETQDLRISEKWSFDEMMEQPLETGDKSFCYDEWDRELDDFRIGWCRVIEKKVRRGDRNFVELVRSRYRGIISSVRHQFQLMKPENLTKINRELDGEEYDLNAIIDYVVDRRADGRQSERIYTRRLRRERDVAVSLLLDQSSSTARTITNHPLQPYTHPGRRIIEIEKEGLVLMSEALEAVGDIYSISGFTSEGRRNVKFYVVKDFDEKYSEDIERRIGGITFQNNTRLGAAVRHASAKLLQRESRTKLMIILTDGKPYDHDYGDAKYAREDVREALTDAKMGGIIPFCITIDRDSEQELKDLYGEVGYTIIDDVLSLPEKLPNIYRRLTS